MIWAAMIITTPGDGMTIKKLIIQATMIMGQVVIWAT